MRLYALYVLIVAAIVIASIAATPGLAERLRRWLIIAVALLVVLPVTLYLLFGGV
jgi:cation transport ATPase